jgi:hypothetical protein
MADVRSSSTEGGNDAPRNASVTPLDMNHLARVDTNVAAEAARATQSEVSMTLLQAIKTYPKAIGWSVLISTCIIVRLPHNRTSKRSANLIPYRWKASTLSSSTR